VRFAVEQDRRRVLPLEITPLVDVVFLLIIFFLTTSSLVELTRADIELPMEPGEEEQAARTPGLVINSDASGRYIVDNQEVNHDTLLAMVSHEIDEAGSPSLVDVLVRADRESSLEHVNRLAEGLMALELERWRLATEVPLGATGP